MNAFVPSATPIHAGPNRARAACTLRPARPAVPFFASAAFGAPVPTRVSPPVAKAATNMEVTIVVGDNEPVESALRRFKKDVLKSGHLFELRRRRYFETNTEKRIRKAAAAKRKARITRNDNRARNNNGAGRAVSSVNRSRPAPGNNTSSGGLTKPSL